MAAAIASVMAGVLRGYDDSNSTAHLHHNQRRERPSKFSVDDLITRTAKVQPIISAHRGPIAR